MTTSGPGGGPTLLRVGGLALVGVAVVSAIIGLASLAGEGSDTRPTAAPTDATPSAVPPPEPAPPPAPVPGEPAPPIDGSVPVPSIGAPPPAGPPGAVPPEAQPGGAPPAGEPGAAPPEDAAAPAPGAPPPAAPAPENAPDPAAPAPPPGSADGNQAAAPAPAPPPAPAPSGGTGGAQGGDVSGSAGSDGTSAVRAPLRVYNNSTITGLATRAADDFRRAGWPIDEVGNYPHGIIPTSTVYYRPGTDEEEPARVLGEQFGLRVNPRFEGLRDASPGIIVIITSDYGR